ncbi:response regulator [Melittangium boletus]|uniref:hybrid sensor histidine kinase/response regulator n=1 Tax=Melittangium boletus TaxID=83453 RepID=UPI003DA37398
MSGTERVLSALLLEDSALDAELLQACLEDGGLRVALERVDTREGFTSALAGRPFDVILCDYHVPGFGGGEALATARASHPETPFLFVSGALGEDTAIELLKQGATDYVLKDRLERLVPCIERALREAHGAAERARAERALRQSEERYRLATLATSDAIWDWDLLTQRVTWNDALRATYGYGGEDIGADTAWWFERIHPEDRERVVQGLRAVVADGGPRWQARYRFRRRDGGYTPVVDRGQVALDAAGRPVRMVGAMQDISAHQEAQEVLARQARFSGLMASVGLALTRGRDRADMLARCAEALVRFLEVPLARVWLLEEGAQVPVPGASAGPRGEGALDVEWVERVARSREPLVASLSGAERFLGHPLLAGDRCVGVVAVVSRGEPLAGTAEVLRHAADSIALGVERLRAQQETARLFEREKAARTTAEEANRLKDEFLATVSHELRTPLTAMLGWVGLLRAGGLPADKSARALETVERNARAQAQLIEDLLDVSRIMAGNLKLDQERVDLSVVVEQALETVRPAAQARALRIRCALDASGRVMGDPHRLQQVVWNLLSNAVKFTPPEGEVDVWLERDDTTLTLFVQDTGQGISPDFLPHVFERFRQAEGGSTRRFGGLGLGLSIVRHLVEMHGGTVGVESTGLGQGACFWVRLPLATLSRRGGPSKGATTPAPLPPPPDTGAPSLEGLRILVVEDEEDTRELLRTLLSSRGASVHVAASAREGLELLRRVTPDLLVSDIGMPGEDGYALIQGVRALPASAGGRLPAVALTAFARAEDRTRVLLAGFNSHVPKPVEPAELFAVLLSLAGRRPGAPR